MDGLCLCCPITLHGTRSPCAETELPRGRAAQGPCPRGNAAAVGYHRFACKVLSGVIALLGFNRELIVLCSVGALRAPHQSAKTH